MQRPEKAMSQEQETLRGVLDHITFHNEENGFTIARLVPDEPSAPVTIVGEISALNLGETIEVTGQWTSHPKYGTQFRFSSYHQVVPSSIEGIRRYLGSGLIKGLGPVNAQRIVDTFGEDTLDIIEHSPERLAEVEGLGPKRLKSIRAAWAEQRAVRETMIFLQDHGISPAYADRIYRAYGSDAVAVVRREPYRLATDIWGIGFLKADQIAAQSGISADDPARLRAGLAWVMSRATEKGHTYLPESELLELAGKELKVRLEDVTTALEDALAQGVLVRNDGRVSPPDLAAAEAECSRRIAMHLENGTAGIIASGADRIIAEIEADQSIQYATEQRTAIEEALRRGVVVITGGPGTGKTTTTLGIISALRRGGARLALCAPTGRAAKRLTEVTKVEAGTIHRLLGYQPDRRAFQHDDTSPLPADVVLVDEASMIDTVLFAALLRAMKPEARLVLVGDADQLPSVGPGQVLRDVIASGVAPFVRLTEVFRQASRSRIITGAHSINRGELPDLSNEREGDFFFLSENDPAHAAETVTDLVTRRLPQTYGVDPLMDIQVLTPMYRGETGAHALNATLQHALNPEGAVIQRGERQFRAGDKIIVTRNNYTKGVFNGDIGRISTVDEEGGLLHLELDIAAEGASVVTYGARELDELALAYAISVHRSQGSEFPVVVLPITTQHYMMLQRNVVYTAVTRAKRLLVMVGSTRALAMAVKNSAVRERNTWLDASLRHAAGDADNHSSTEDRNGERDI